MRFALVARAFLAFMVPHATACAPVNNVPAPADRAARGTTAFIGVDVIPMNTPGLLRNQTVIIEDDRISAMGDSQTMPVPPGARRIDGRGRFLLPGLVDTHVHLSPDEARIGDELLLYLANGVTTVRSLDGRPSHLAWRARVASGEVGGPTVFTCGPQVFGRVSPIGRLGVAPDQSRHLRWLSRTRTPESVRDLVAEQKRQGYDCLKIYSGPDWASATYAAAVDAASEARLPVVGHFARNLPLDVNLRGRTSVDHIEEFNYTYFFKETPAGAWAAREALLPEVAKRVASAKVGVTTTIWYIRQASLIGRVETGRSVRTADEIQYLPASEVRRLNGKSVDAVSEREQRSTNSNLAFQLRMARSFVDAGVSLMTGTDASLRSLVVPGFSLHRELGELTAAGLTPYEAIRAATVAPSQVLGRRSGTVTVGHAADLILLDGNPLLDIASLRRNAGVMARGRWFPTSALQDSLLAVRGRARDR